MVIGVNARLFLPQVMEGIARYSWETTRRMIEGNPQDHFVLFFDRPIDPRYRIAENMTCVRSFPPSRHPILWKWWFDFSLPRLFRKHKIDVFYSGDGYLSLRSDVPTLLVSHDITYFHFPEYMRKEQIKYLRNHVPRFHEKAAHIIAVSEFTKTDLVQHLGLDPSKITVAYNALPSSKQSGLSPKKKDFLLYVGSLHPRKNIENLLRGFDGFLELLKESGYRAALPKLKLAGRAAFSTETIDGVHSEMKNGSYVEFLGSVTEELKWTLLAEAKCMCYVSKWEGFGIPLLEAMSVETPVITSNLGALKEVSGDAAILVNPEKPDEISRAMLDVWTKEKLRKELTEKGVERVKDFDWDETTKIIYAALQEIAR